MKKALFAFAGLGLALSSYANPGAVIAPEQSYLVQTDDSGEAIYYRVPEVITNEAQAERAIDQYARPEFLVDAAAVPAATELNSSTSQEAWHRRLYRGYYRPRYRRPGGWGWNMGIGRGGFRWGVYGRW